MHLASIASALAVALAPVGEGGSLGAYDGGPDRPRDLLFDAQFTTSGPVLLPASITVNGSTLTPFVSFFGSDATASAWAMRDGLGETFTKVEDGANITTGQAAPFLDGETAADFNAGDYYLADDTTTGDVALEDLVIEYVVRVGAAAGVLAEKSNAAPSTPSAGWNIYSGGTYSAVVLGVAGGSVNLNAVGCNHIGTTIWAHCIWFIDRSENSTKGALVSTNGGTIGSSGNASALVAASLTVAAEMSVGAADRAGAGGSNANASGAIAYLRMWKCSGCLANSNTTEEQAIALERASKLFGMYPQFARGAYAPTAMTRATHSTLRIHSGGMSKLHLVSLGWMRTTSDAIGAGFLSEPSVQNLALQSADLATSWTLVNVTDTIATQARADFLINESDDADAVVADATDTEHGVSQAITVTGTTYTTSAFCYPGAVTWAYLTNDTAVNAYAYFDCTNCAVGSTTGAAASNIFAESYGGSWCRVGFTYTGTAAAHTHRYLCAQADNDKSFAGDAAAHSCYLTGIQVELSQHVTSFQPTTTAAVTRDPDILSYDASGANYAPAQGSMLARFYTPNVNYTGGVGILETGTANDMISLTIDTSTDRTQSFVFSGGGDTGGILAAAGTGDIANGAIHSAVKWWKANFAMLVVDGTKSTADTTVTVPSTQTAATVKIGRRNAGGSQLNGNVVSVKFWNRPEVIQ